MKYFVLTVFILSFCFHSCIRNTAGATTEEENKELLDTSNTVIISFDSSNLDFPRSHNAELSQTELKTLDSLLQIFITDHDGHFAKDGVGHSKIDISKYNYKKQFVPFITSDGEKKVWANYFCSDSFMDWHREVIFVHDGGDCFFNLIINLNDSSYSMFFVNGEA